MDVKELLKAPICKMNGEDLVNLSRYMMDNSNSATKKIDIEQNQKKFVYGIKGLSELLGCSIPTAQRVKVSGTIDDAICQVGRKIIIDSEKALSLLKKKKGGRRYV